MFRPTSAFSGFSVDDLAKAKTYYSATLGLTVEADGIGARIHLPGGATVFCYPKPDHVPATFTILNFEVEDIDDAVTSLTARGVVFERYEGIKGIDASGSPSREGSKYGTRYCMVLGSGSERPLRSALKPGPQGCGLPCG